MISISLCMIVKNEQDTLPKCLSSVDGLVDEIIIVDTGSDDGTKAVAAEYTDKIYDFAWIDDFSAARNYSYSRATMDYILWLDADDVILPQDAAKFLQLKQTLPDDTETVMMKYNTGFDQQGGVIFSCFRERLTKRSLQFKWKEPVHEYLDTGWKRMLSDVCITHAKPYDRPSGRNIRIYETVLAAGGSLSPRGMYYYARELKDHARYADAIEYFQLFLDSGLGWVEDNISACGELSRCWLAERQPERALNCLFRSFSYDTPRAEICCQIGYFYKAAGDYMRAIFWFELILSLDRNKNAWGFRQEDCWGYIPCIELALCYDKLREFKKAERYNEMAGGYKPDSPAVSYNRQYFSNLAKNMPF